MNRAFYKRKFLEEQEKKVAQPVETQRSTSHIPILQQLEAMLIGKLQKPEPSPFPVHTVQAGDTLSGMARQYLEKGERWPEIRDINIPVLEEGLKRFQPGDPRLERELGHWIFPGQEFQIPVEPPPVQEMPPEAPDVPPVGLQEELQRILRGEPARRFSEEDLVKPVRDAKNIMPPVEAEHAGPMLDPRQRGIGPEAQKYEWPVSPKKEKPEAVKIDTDKLLEEYINWNYTRKGKTPTEENIAVAAKQIATHPEMYVNRFAQEAPKNTAGKIGNFLNRMSEAGADAFTLTEGDMPKATTGNSAADGIADTIGSLMGFLSPEGPAQAFAYAGQVLWGIAPKLAKTLKVPVNLVYRSLSAGAGMAAISGYKAGEAKDVPKEMLKGGAAGIFMGASEHIAGPMINSITRKLGIPVESTAEKLLEAIHTQGTAFSTLSAGYSVLEGNPAKQVAQDALTGYVLGGLLGGLGYGYSEVTTKIATDKGKTMRVKEFMRVVEEQGLRPQYDTKGKHTGYWTTADGKHAFSLTVSYKGKAYDLGELIDRPLMDKMLSFDFGELPRGVEPTGVLRTPHTEPRHEGHIPQRGAPEMTADFYAHPEFGTVGRTTAEGGATRTRAAREPLGLPEPKEVVIGPEAPAPKMPSTAYDLVVRTKSPLKKQYGRDIIAWLEGGEKPAVPEGLSEADAKDMEIKLSKMAEREGIRVPEVELTDREVTATVPAAPKDEPLRFNPQTNSYNGRKLTRGDLFTDKEGTTYRLDRQLGYMLQFDVLGDDGRVKSMMAFSVDPSNEPEYRDLFYTGRNFYEEELPAKGEEPIPATEKPTSRVPMEEVTPEHPGEELPVRGEDAVGNIGYHAGDLGKAEGLGSQATSRRGTGHFGTGTYFVSNPEKLQGKYSSHKDREKHEVDFTGYNLFKPKDRSEANALHGFLRTLNTRDYQLAKMDEIDSDQLKEINYADPGEAVAAYKKYGVWDDQEFMDRTGISTEQYISGEAENRNTDKYVENVQRQLKQLADSIGMAKLNVDDFLSSACRALNLSEKEVQKLADEVLAEVESEIGDRDGYGIMREMRLADSASTRFMKRLGYEGVDVRHVPEFDNTEYGSVIYDLKEKLPAGEKEPPSTKEAEKPKTETKPPIEPPKGEKMTPVGEKPDFVGEVIDTKLLGDKEAINSILGDAAVCKKDQLHATHVSSNPEITGKRLRDGKPIREGRVGDFGEMGGGLYGSATPTIWVGRATEKWGFLGLLDKGQRSKLAIVIRDVVSKKPKGYISKLEMDRFHRDLDHWTEGKLHSDYITMFSDQPYNVEFWKPEFLEPLGIEPGKQPVETEMILEGKFAEIKSGLLTEDQVKSLKEHGFDGAFAPIGHLVLPQIVVWNNDAVIKFGDLYESEKYVAPDKLKPFKPIAVGKAGKAWTEKDEPIEFDYALAEGNDIVTSFKGVNAIQRNEAYFEAGSGLQPRDINRKHSWTRILDYTKKLNPERMGINAEISNGAPVLGDDGRVEIGNHRTYALILAYIKDEPLAKEYREWLMENARDFGLDPDEIKIAKAPILVRIRKTKVDRVAFAQVGNVPGEAKQSAAEIAEIDAGNLNTGIISLLVPNAEGRIETAANKDFISAFLGIVPMSDRGSLLDKDGNGLSQEGITRIRNALFARTFGNANALIKLSEETDANVKNIMNAMVTIMPQMLKQKNSIDKGEYYPLNISNHLARAMVKLSELRDSKMTVEGYFTARQLFGTELTTLEKNILATLDKHKFSGVKIGDIFKHYMAGVEAAGRPGQISIIDERPPTKPELFRWAVDKMEKERGLTESEKKEAAGQTTLLPTDKGMDDERDRSPGEKDGEGEGTGRDKLAEQEEKLDKKAGEHKHELSAGQSVRIVRGRPSDGEHTFETAEVEVRYQAAHGVETPGFWRKTQDMLTELGHMFSRSHKHLPNTGYYMPCRNLLINLAKGKSIAADKTVRRMKGILADLLEDRPAYNLFERKVIMDDLKEGYDRYLDSLKESGMSEAQIPFRWQFGFTKDTFAKEYKLLNDAISKNPVVEKVLKERADFWDALVGAYTEAQKAIGHKVDSKFTRTSYYRHQVLEYAHARSVIVGTGERLKTPRGRSWLKHRIEEGSELDFNTNYLEAEFEAIAQMYYDMQVAEAIGKIDKRYNIVDQLKAQAVEVNDERIMPFMQEIADALNKMKGSKVTKDYTAEDVYRNILNKKTAIGFDRLGELAASGALPDRNGDFAKLIAELSNVYLTNKATKKKLGKDWTIQDQAYLPDKYANQIFSYCNWLLKAKGNIPAKGAAATIFKGIHEKRDTIKKTLGRNYVTWEDLIPEGFTIWQPTKGNVFFFADTIPAGIAERLIEGELEQVGVTKDMLRRVLAKGGRNKEMVVDANIAATLDDLTGGSKSSSLVWNISKSAMDLWKEWQLISPPRYVKFNLRNFTGDVEYPFALNPRLLKYAPQAMKDLFDFMVRGAKPTKLIAAWAERGGLQSTLQYQEMGAINHLKDFENLVKKHKSIKDIPANVFRKYWETARLTTDYREGILRYAAFTEAVEGMKGNIKPAYLNREGNIADGHLQEAAPRNFGVSDKEEIMSLDNIYDRAYWISNELIGAYDRVSTAGKFLRTYLMPFWSWKEVNLTRFIKTMKLIANDDTIAERVGRYFVNKVRGRMGMSPLSRNTRRSKSAWRKVATSPLILARIGTVMIKLMAFWIATGLFNRYFFPDSQYTLPRETRKSYHLVVGRDEKGSLIYYDRLGSMSDLFEWIGDTPWNYVIDVMTGRKTAVDVAKEMSVAPVKLMYGELGPHFQLATELITGKSTFPDPTDPGDIQNRWRHIMQGLGLAAVYDRIARKPTRTYGDDAKRLIAYVQEPGQGAYYDIRDEVREFLSSEGAAQGRWSGEYNARSDALYNLRLAIRYEDQEAIEKYAVLYVNSGGTKNGLETSLKNLHPLGQLSDARKGKFVNEWLDEEGKERLRWAEKFYYETLLGNPKGQFGYPTETMERISKAVYADRK